MSQNGNNNSIKKKKSDLVIIGLIILSIFLIVFSFLAPLIFTTTSINSRYDFTETGFIGDTIGGIMNPFIALAGVFVTFLAFYMQLKANKIQIDLFNKNQEEQTNLLKEQLFFRLVDNLNQRIINFSNSENNSYKSLDTIINLFLELINIKCIDLGRQLLASQPENIESIYYFKILQAKAINKTPSIDNAEQLKQSIIDKINYHDRWENLKAIIGSGDTVNDEIKNILKSIGSFYFYKIKFSERENIYINVYDSVYKEFGWFLDVYTKNLSYLLDFVIINKENLFFIDYLKSNLSTQELILIFYFCASKKSNENFRNKIKKTNLLDEITQARDKFIDLPSKTELKLEIELILNKSDIILE